MVFRRSEDQDNPRFIDSTSFIGSKGVADFACEDCESLIEDEVACVKMLARACQLIPCPHCCGMILIAPEITADDRAGINENQSFFP